MKIQQELINQIKQIVDPELILEYLGFHLIRRTPKELRGPCKVHGGDNPTAFRFNLEARSWCCYTRHCEGETDRDIIGLIQKTQGLPFLDSVKLLADIAGVDLNDSGKMSEEFLKLKQKQEMRKEIQNASRSSVASILSEEILDEFRLHRSNYFTERNFPEELLDFYEIGGTTDSYNVHRETIPIRNEDGDLLTVSMRRIDSDMDPKYVLLEDIPKGKTLYNLHVAKHYVGEDRTLILVEGFVDVWRLSLLGIYNVVAAMGTALVPEQVQLLWKYAENIILLLDGDSAGYDAAPKVSKMLDKGALIRMITLPEGKDPKDFTYEDVQYYILEENSQ